MNGNFNIKIGDFGLATELQESKYKKLDVSQFFDEDLTKNIGTPIYQSPEQIEGNPYNEKVDIYSMGIILMELCSNYRTYSERKFCIEQLRNNSIMQEKIVKEFPKEAELIRMMTQKIPSKRPTAYEISTSEEYKSLQFEFEN